MIDYGLVGFLQPATDRRLNIAHGAAEDDQVLPRTDRPGHEHLHRCGLEHLVLGLDSQADAGELHCADRSRCGHGEHPLETMARTRWQMTDGRWRMPNTSSDYDDCWGQITPL